MSLFSQGNTEKSAKIYLYTVIGGLCSLLMLFLVKQSLPLNRQESQKYQQKIQDTKQSLLALEQSIIQSISSRENINSTLAREVNKIQDSLDSLKAIPTIIGQQEKNILIEKLETQAVFLDSQKKSLDRFQEYKLALNNSCQYIPKLRNDLNNTTDRLNSQLFFTITNLLDNAVLHCYDRDRVIALTIKSQINKVEFTIEQANSLEQKFLANEAIQQAKNIITIQEKKHEIYNQIDVAALNLKIIEFESDYLEKIGAVYNKVYTYRFITYVWFSFVIIVVAQQIISNLIRTNRNIVKILESFTQELETKVEQRTAQLEESIQNTEAALAQAQNANQAKSRFLANMSHELRTPLNAILGFTQLMCRDTSIGQEHQENIQIINRSGEHLLKLINDILEMSKIEVGQITLNETKFDLRIMLKSIEDMLRLKADAKKIDLTFELDKNLPQYINTDEGKLRQIIINLLGNALKFTQQGAVTLSVKLKDNFPLENTNIDFLFSDTNSLYFTVKDSGPGIPQSEMEQLFSPFEQTTIGRISNEGTGLGLSICQKFVELMGGKIAVESEVGKGSIFHFEILIKVENSNNIAVFEPQKVDSTKRIIGLADPQIEYRILAVDDVPASRLLLKKILTEIGFIVAEAGDGKQVVEKFSSWHPHLILMDMRMPIMDGYEATKQIKSLPGGRGTIVIALTASAFEEERVAILSAGCDDFMRKPFYESELLETIGQYLNIDYVYEEIEEVAAENHSVSAELTRENLEVMSLEWRSQLYDAAARVDDREILELLADIPQEYESLAKGLKNLVEHFRCDKIIDLTKLVN